MEINWFWTLVIGTIFSIPFSILSNLLTPKFQKWLNKRSQLSRNKSIKQLKEGYERAKKYNKQPELLQLETNEKILNGISAILRFIGGGSAIVLPAIALYLLPVPFDVDIKTAIIQGTLLLAIIGLFFSSANEVSSIIEILEDYSHYKEFEEYEKRVISEIQLLEENNHKENVTP